ncbi:uncharacterized protein isoform X1 [Leptinotarsa decemlineata]|uniref:uncharacterized protein isoform X1 n=2 Tax=Leptinotarsa decemlineata TaxID=7539 RepID=UPI003D3072FD
MEVQVPLPTVIKLEEESNTIDLDAHTSPEDIVFQWSDKVRTKFKNFFIADTERDLDIIMKWYIQSFREEAMHFDHSEAVKSYLFKHIEFFKLFFDELECPFTDNYLDNMEELLTMYSDLEAETLPSKQNEPNKRSYNKSISKICFRIIEILNAYLMYREDRLYHVLMKIKLNLYSDEAKDLLNLIYGKILTKDPTNKSDLAFCRAYILYQKWKRIREEKEWKQMDQVMYKMYGRTPDSLSTNNTLKRILLPQSELVLDVLSHLIDYTLMSDEYFKFIKTQNIQEDSLIISDFNDIDLDDRSSLTEVTNEDEEFEHAYNNYIESMSRISDSCDIIESPAIKEEDDCCLVGVGTVDCEQGDSKLVHEILDDEDDDIVEIIFLEKKDQTKNVEPSSSFLDSISLLQNRSSPSRGFTVSNATSFLDSISLLQNRTSPSRGFTVSNATSSTESYTRSHSSYNTSPVPILRPSSPDVLPPEEVIEQFEEPSSNDKLPRKMLFSNSDFVVPSTKPPRTRKRINKESMKKKRFLFKKLMKRRRPLMRKTLCTVKNNDNSHKHDTDANSLEKTTDVNKKPSSFLPKNVSHIETQTDFSQPEDIYRMFKGLVTPPSDEHHEDHDIHTTESPNVYTGFLPSSPCSTREQMTDTDFLTSSNKSVNSDGITEKSDNRNTSSPKSVVEERDTEDVPHSPPEQYKTQTDGASEIKSASNEANSGDVSRVENSVSESCCTEENKSKQLNGPSLNSLSSVGLCAPSSNSFLLASSINSNLKLLCTSSDISCDYSPSSSTVSPNLKHKNSNDPYSSLASPDISSTSHDHFPECSTRKGDSEENQMGYGSVNESFSDNEDQDYVVEEDIQSQKGDSDINGDCSDDILIEHHYLDATNGEVVIGLNNQDNTDEETVDNITKNIDYSEAHTSLSRNEATDLKIIESCQSKRRKYTEPNISFHISASDPSAAVRTDQKRNFEYKEMLVSNHSTWNKIMKSHEIDDIWSGPLEKVNGLNNCENPDKTFDLFDNEESQTEISSEALLGYPSQPSVTSITSPSYENPDDFRSYINNLKAKNNTVEIPHVESVETSSSAKKSCDHMVNKKSVRFQLDNNDLRPSNTPALRSNTVKKKRITFAEDIIDIPVIHSPLEISRSKLQSSLKNPIDPENNRYIVPKRNTRPRIPRRMMNLKSLARFNVKPNDPCLQGVPCVIVERLSKTEIDEWKNVSTISRKVRLQKSQSQNSFMSYVRIDYDKSTSKLNENDVVYFNQPEGSNPAAPRQWRRNKFQLKDDTPQEGTVTSRTFNDFSDSDYNSTPVQCTNACCSSLTTELTQLNVTKTRYESILNLSCEPNFSISKCQNCPSLNPFSSKPARRKKRKLSQETKEVESSKSNYFYVASIIKSPDRCSTSLDLNIISSIVESFDAKCDNSVDDFCLNPITLDKSNDISSNEQQTVDSLNVNALDFDCNINTSLNQQPAAVPELEDFEKTLKSEELAKPLTIPSDLHNLNLNRFSPSPINCFSPCSDSPGHIFLSHSPALNENHFLGGEPNDCSQMGNNYGIQPDSFFSQENCFESFRNSSPDSPETENKPDASEHQLPEDKKDYEGELKSENKTEDYKQILAKLDINSLDEEPETRLPLKKRKLSVPNSKEEDNEDDLIGPDLVEEILKRARAEGTEKDDISYPAKPAISIAEIQEKLVEPQPRTFKTPAEKKEMPPPYAASKPSLPFLEHPKIVTEQYNNHTYNNPTINYHMNNVPYPFFPCGSLPYFSPILLPLNSTTTFDMNLVPPQQQQHQPQMTMQEPVNRPRKEKKSKKKKKD